MPVLWLQREKDPRKAIYTHVDDEEKTTLGDLGGSYSGILTKSTKFTAVHISERGLCSLIASSKLPYTKAVQNWVLNGVLPTIRQMGGYITHSVAEDVEPIRTDTRRVHADALSSSSSSSSAPVDLHQKLENITKDLCEFGRELYQQRTQNSSAVTRERSLKRQRGYACMSYVGRSGASG